ncbi:biosynthetic-type acetolactate synthase large subunit [uncultured Chloroflexus sp.]|uniref:biosynthetic-type acetolactate synthase large subunit n=1 Tax=uncultured Chloroflexus sp. TaxID=214040 RepID=UPI0026064A85|nr:biosynthetic-type acetolactate synthase large subunit [uncultured Chloroflexus sp.]
MTKPLTGAQIMCEALIREGVEVMFGIPGGAIMPFYYAMWDYRDRLRHVLCRHEQGAGHAAEGYARATGKIGVCIGTSGPGATNLVTPIADAMMDSTPLLAITGQVGSHVLGKDAFQETDITGITMPITKHNYLVKNVDELPYVFKEAIHIATTGRPGPVLIDITKDAMQKTTVPNWDIKLNLPGYKPTYQGNRRQIREAIKLLISAKKPLIIAGHGIIMAGAHRELQEFAERLRIPVITTLHGIGAIPENHPLAIGMPGMHGWVHVNRAIQECDVLFNIGGRFDDRVTGKASTFAPHARIIHVDIDPSEIGKNVRVDVPIVGDARLVLQALLEDLPPPSELAELHTHASDWMEHIREMQDKHQGKQQYKNRAAMANMSLPPHDVYEALSRTLNARGNYRVVTDVGQHQMWAAQLIDWNHGPRTHITSGGAGTMGFAVPAALGVAIAYPNETVWAIVGDGGFQMTNQEMATIVQEGLKNVKVAVINNGYLGMVRQWQELFEHKRYSGTPLSGPNFAKLAEAYGWKGLTVERSEDVQAAIDEAHATDGPVLIDFRVEREVNVFPMVPQNKSIGEMILSESQA